MRVKGEVERDMKKLPIPHLMISKPGLLVGRDNDKRIGEKIGEFIPFIPKIESADMGLAMLDHAIKSTQNKVPGPKVEEFRNRDLLNYVRSINANL